MTYMMVIERVDGRLCHVTKWDVTLIRNFINKTTLDKSWIPLVYENLFKTFCCYLCHSLSLSLSMISVSTLVMVLIFAEEVKTRAVDTTSFFVYLRLLAQVN